MKVGVCMEKEIKKRISHLQKMLRYGKKMQKKETDEYLKGLYEGSNDGNEYELSFLETLQRKNTDKGNRAQPDRKGNKE